MHFIHTLCLGFFLAEVLFVDCDSESVEDKSSPSEADVVIFVRFLGFGLVSSPGYMTKTKPIM